jgi:prepilin-type N-terminal cleavage/methylation domain-containing protein
MFMNFNKKNKKGFTLIELMIVAAIISVLMSVVVASLADSRQKAEVQKLEQELQNIATASQLYLEQNRQWPNINYDGTSSVNDLAEVLNNAELFGATEIEIPASMTLLNVRDGYNISGTNNASCGNPVTESYFVLPVSTLSDISDHFGKLKPMYINNSLQDGFYCFEIN